MPLAKIFKGIATMDETPEELWSHITNELGPQFFMSVIEKNYAHMFSTTVSKASEEIENALAGQREREQVLFHEATQQVAEYKQQVDDLNEKIIKVKAVAAEEASKAAHTAKVETKMW